ncbi:MAG: SDR family oxidoreductase [Anaerolineae bacterium]|nr:SDR family oxidoreductase [Anaerolineae bacterium]
MSDFSGQTVLITGAGRGFGRTLAHAFAARGALVAANDLTPVNVDEVVANITKAGGRATSYLADVCKKVALQSMVTQVLEDCARIDILINHAAVQPHDPLLDMDEWDWHRTLDVNLTGAFLAMQSVGRVMRELGGGVILNIGPTQPDPAHPAPRAAYLAAKHGLLALTRAAAPELSPANIRVNAISLEGEITPSIVSKALELCSPAGAKITGQVLTLPAQ